MPQEAIDANTEAASSTASTGAGESATDAIDASSASESTTKTSAKSGQTMESVINDAFKKSTESSSQEAEVKEIDKEDVEEKETAKEVEDKEAEKVEDKPEESEDQEKSEKADEKGPVPYERFQEVVAKRQEIESRLKEIEPVAIQHQKIVDYCGANNIAPEQFSQALEIAALMNTDPAKALERLTPIINELQGFTGNKLPEDLQNEVDAGDLPLARAKEIAQLRAQQQFGKRNSEQQQRTQQQRQEREFQTSLTTAAQSWEQAKRGTDPDYRPKKENSPDGKWELTRDKFLALLHQQDDKGQFANPVRTPQDMSLLLERAYQQVNETFGGLLQQTRKPTKTLTRNGSSTTTPKSPSQAKSIDEAMQLAAAKHGYH